MITADKRKAVFLLHQEGVSKRAIARQLRLSRNAVRRIIAQSGQMPPPIRSPRVVLDPDRLRQLHQECEGYAQRMMEKLREEHGITVKYSTLTRHLRDLGIIAPSPERCQRVPDEPGAEMQHDTSPFTLLVGSQRLRLQASLLYLRYSKRRYLQFHPVFDRFHLKCFLHLALMHWGHAPRLCVIDNTNLARWYGLGAQAVMVPEMEAFCRSYGFKFLCHAPKHSDRKAGEERSFLTVETNFVPGRTFANLEDLNRQALEWSTVRMEQRPQGKARLIPAQAFEHERPFLTPLPRHLPAPYQLLERSVDEYGYVAVDANYYEVPGTGRGQVQVLRYLRHLVLCQDRRAVIEYSLLPWDVKNQIVRAPGQPARYRPRNLKLSSHEEEKRLRALAPEVSAYVDFIFGTLVLRHQFLRRLWARHQRWGTALFRRTVERAHRYHITSLETLERIAQLLLDETALPDPVVDPDLERRPAYQEGSLTDIPDLSRYDE
ncbi:MAG: transposase [Limisphaerales bacterium]